MVMKKAVNGSLTVTAQRIVRIRAREQAVLEMAFSSAC
jgi:hypothetical protein